MIDETLSAPSDYDGTPILPSLDGLGGHPTSLWVLSAVGDPNLRRRWAEQHGPRYPFATVIDPTAIIAEPRCIAEGCVVLAGAILSTEVSVGAHSILGFNVSLSHETSVGSFCHLAGGVILNGNARVGSGCRIGAGAIILPGIEVGDDAVVGAGAMVTRHVAPGITVAGVPARRLRPTRT
jgi:sugar O-acyltransferase (sialic acid O-acetyltransferase NeuD family)